MFGAQRSAEDPLLSVVWGPAANSKEEGTRQEGDKAAKKAATAMPEGGDQGVRQAVATAAPAKKAVSATKSPAKKVLRR